MLAQLHGQGLSPVHRGDFRAAGHKSQMKTTRYFDATRQRPDRSTIELTWIQFVAARPQAEQTQADGRIRRWATISECGGRWLRVVLLADGETVHDAFFDRRFTP